MVLNAPAPADSHPLKISEIVTPTPAPGEVRVRLTHCGVCHTDLHIVEGDLKLPRLPIVPGHQIVGFVDAVGSGVTQLREGDRVGIPWLHSTDGTCQYCRAGNENLCDNAQFTGFNVNGGYADYTLVEESFACALPKSFTDLQAAPLLCAGIVGYRSFKLSGARKGDRLGLYGFGASAHIVLQVARHIGCEVYVFTRSPIHKEVAARLGATWTGDAKDTPPSPLDSAIIFAPSGALVPEALRVTGKGGTVALAGITMSPIPRMDYDLLYHERILRSVANATRQDAREFLEIAAEIPVQTQVDLFDLAQANEALIAVKHSRVGAAAVLKIS